MAWCPRDPTGKDRETSVTKQDIIDRHKNPSNGLADFIACIKEGDTIVFHESKHLHGGANRYIGRRSNGFVYVYVVSSWMS